MKIPLEEWQRQRKHVQEHLDWLDEQISRVTKGDTTASSPAPEATPPPAAESANKELPSLPETPQIEGLGTYSKVGCIALGIFFCLLFLFLVFGLPYFIYR